MRNIFRKLFGDTENDNKIPASGFGTSLEQSSLADRLQNFRPKKKDVMVNTDVAFHKPAYKLIDEIKSKFKDTDYTNLEFEEEIEDFNLKALSTEAKNLIIQIIKEDMKFRTSKIESIAQKEKRKGEKMLRDIQDRGWKAEYSTITVSEPTEYGINPKTGEILPFTESTKVDLISFSEYSKIETIMNNKKLLETKELLLYKFVANSFPDKSHDEIIEFIKQNLKLDEAKN